eukprot:scaffold32195_cov65-Phaeocystis_antarctica.AAC.4
MVARASYTASTLHNAARSLPDPAQARCTESHLLTNLPAAPSPWPLPSPPPPHCHRVRGARGWRGWRGRWRCGITRANRAGANPAAQQPPFARARAFALETGPGADAYVCRQSRARGV